MPLTERRVFRVRQYECDYHGYASDAAFLRFMQETAFDASTAAGYDVGRYDAINRRWLVRETVVDYLGRLRFGDQVEVKSWVTDFRQVRSRRDYELRHVESKRLVARAFTDWVFIDLSIHWPTLIPADLMAAFRPEGPVGKPPPELPNSRFPSPPPAPPGTFRQARRVDWRDLDTGQHVNNAVYVDYLEDANRQVLASLGWPLRRWQEAGLALSTQRHRVEYRQPALPDDELRITLWLSDVTATSAVRHATVTRAGDNTLLTRARTRWHCRHLETDQPASFPEALLADLVPLTAPGSEALEAG